jgi:pimeloyl-ACP methyl ester carboxylesterase
MRTILDKGAPSGGPHNLLVMLPGADNHAADFFDHGLVDDIRQAGGRCDVLALETGIDRYLDGRIVEDMHPVIAEAARDLGAHDIWLLGISLGGLGALLYARAHRPMVAGVLAMSPYIGNRGQVAEITRAGGLARWRNTGHPTLETALLEWLRGYDGDPAVWPELWLAYATEDRYAQGHRLLADILPKDRVVTVTGGHDWPSWKRLWQLLVTAAPSTVA